MKSENKYLKFIPHYNCCIYDLSKRNLKKVGYSPQSWTIQTLIKWQQIAAIKKNSNTPTGEDTNLFLWEKKLAY